MDATCVSSLFQVIEHISTDLYAYKLTSMCPRKQYDKKCGKNVVLQKALYLLATPVSRVAYPDRISNIKHGIFGNMTLNIRHCVSLVTWRSH